MCKDHGFTAFLQRCSIENRIVYNLRNSSHASQGDSYATNTAYVVLSTTSDHTWTASFRGCVNSCKRKLTRTSNCNKVTCNGHSSMPSTCTNHQLQSHTDTAKAQQTIKQFVQQQQECEMVKQVCVCFISQQPSVYPSHTTPHQSSPAGTRPARGWQQRVQACWPSTRQAGPHGGTIQHAKAS